MSKLLLNGCSYAHCWHNAGELSSRLGYEQIHNIGLPGSSNDRIFRSTFEYITKNSDVDFVILMITFFDRQEAPWATETSDYDGKWIGYTPNGIIPYGSNVRMNGVSTAQLEIYERYIRERYKVDVDFSYIDKLIIDMVTMSAWLDKQNIKHCFFNPCEHLIGYGYPGFDTDKLKWVRENKRIIDIENFLSNEWMHKNGAIVSDEERAKFENSGANYDPRWAHYGEDGYAKLNDFLYNYITANCL